MHQFNTNTGEARIRQAEKREKERVENGQYVFGVNCEDAEKQILQVCIAPGKTIYFKGKIEYTTDLSEKKDQLPISFGTFAFVNFPIFFNELTNMSKKNQIIGATHQTLSGPIVILNLDTYQDSFYINYLNIVASTSKVQEKKFSQKLSYFRLFENEQVKNINANGFNLYKNQIVAIQSNGPIIEKYLAPQEQFIVYDEQNLLAHSKSIMLQRIKPKNNNDGRTPVDSTLLYISGPGWIFFTTKLGSERRMARKAGMFNICLVLTMVLLVFSMVLPMF